MPRKRQNRGADEVTRTVIKRHRHAGEWYEVDDPITVRPGLLPTLEAFGVIAPGTAEDAGGDSPGQGDDPMPGTFPPPDEAEMAAMSTDDEGASGDERADGED